MGTTSVNRRSAAVPRNVAVVDNRNRDLRNAKIGFAGPVAALDRGEALFIRLLNLRYLFTSKRSPSIDVSVPSERN